MAWTAEKVKAMRETSPAKAAQSEGWTAEKVRAMRTKTPTAPQKSTDQSTPNDLYATALEGYRLMKRDAPSTPNVLTDTDVGAKAYGTSLAQKQKQYNAQHGQKDVFDELNAWYDEPGNRQLVKDLIAKKNDYTTYAEQGTSRNADSAPAATALMGNSPYGLPKKETAPAKYTEAELREKGYSAEELAQGRDYLTKMQEIPEWKQATRRTANAIGGIADTVAAAPLLAGENAVQAGKNLTQSAENRRALEAEVAQSPREKNLYDRLLETDMDYKPKYSTGDLLQQGFTRDEIDRMKARIAGTEAQGSIDPEKNLGYQLYDRGQQLNAAALSGLDPMARAAVSVATSAGENLLVGGINPAAVLPVLSAQGAAEAMGQSAANGDSAGKTLAGGLAKFGAGWAINSVGAADLARTMGSDYAKDTVAGKIADWVRGMAGDSDFAKQYPAVANAISGGIDNAMQAFVETYADQAIDAALGDKEAAQTLFDKETFLTALESGLSGGASGALGGAVGTGLAQYNNGNASWLGQAEAYDAQDRAARAEQQQRKALERTEEPGAAAENATFAQAAEETAVNDDPAVHTPAQNASIEEYKNSVDPKMAEYVDRVRAGEQLEPYVVAQTSDRMRSAMMELTGLKKVGDRTLLDANAVQHITNRHAGGDGSADGTMKNSADVARAAYVLNHFDHAYLAKDRAEGYMTSKGKRAPIVLFEKKIDGSHIVVEAACDTKKNTNYIVSEYLAKNGVDLTEVTEGLRSPVSATSDPGVHVRNVVADPSANTSIAPTETNVNDQTVEKAGKSVESSPEAETTPLRETYGLRESPTQDRQANRVKETLRRWQVSEKGAEALSRQLPTGLDADVYAAAASSMYRLGRMEDVDSFDKALRLAGTENHLGLNVSMVLSRPTGRNALEMAYLQGRGELEARAAAQKKLGGTLSEQSMSGEGRTYFNGTLREMADPATRIIALNAQGTGTDAVLKSVLNGPDGAPDPRVKAKVDTETGRIFFGDNADDVFGTVLHEDYHWYNALDAEGARSLQDHVLRYLAEKNGYEDLDALIHARMGDYAAQKLTYEQAAEELVADAWRGIFDSEESFARWAQFQREQAEKNAGKAKGIHKVMEQVKSLLDSILSKAREILRLDPENTAAEKARRLAEAEKRTLQDEYFAHAETAMENLRTAKENAAAPGKERASEKAGTRYQIDSGFEKAIDALDETSRYAYPIRVGTTSDVLKSIGVQDRAIVWNSNKIRKILTKHSAENFRAGADGSIMTKEIIKQVPQVLEHPILVIHSDTSRNADYASRVFMYGDVKDAAGKPVNVSLELLPTDYKGLAVENIVVLSAYGHDSYRPGRVLQGEVLYADPDTKRTSRWLRDNRLSLPFSLASAGPKAILRYRENGVKAVDVEPLPGQRRYYLKAVTEQQAQQLYPEAESAPGGKGVRYQMAEKADREARGNSQRQASRTIAQRDAALNTLMDFFGITRGVRISDDSLEGMALRIINKNGARGKMKAGEFAKELRPLVEYMKADGAEMSKAESMAEVLAGEVLDHATTRNTELWDQYPEYHTLHYIVAKGGKAEAELARRYGSWSKAVEEARNHGVQLRREEGHRDGNPAEQYESIVNDTRAVGGVQDGAAALFRNAARAAGVEGAASMEASEWLEVLMNVRDAIKPKMMSRFADAAEYEDAKVELAGQMLGEVMQLNEMTDAQTIFEGIQKHNRDVAAAAAGEPLTASVPPAAGALRSSPTKGSHDFKEAQKQAMRNREAEKLLDQNLDLLGVDITNVGDLNEKLEVLRETYEREWKAEKKRMREERQQMLDDIRLERRQLKAENAALARQVAGEQQRADRAERQLIFQENDIMEWEAENQRKAEAWQQKQAQRNAMAIEMARQQRDEDVAVAKALAEKRVQKARKGRQKDELKRSIRSNVTQLNQLILRPGPGKYVQKRLMVQAAEVAKLADQATLNFKAVQKLEALRNSVQKEMGSEGSASGMSVDWEQSGIVNLIDALEMDLTETKQAKLDKLNEQLTQAEALPDSEKARALQQRLRERIRETENKVYLPMTVDQMRMLKAITSTALHVIRTANKTLSLEKAQEVDAMAMNAAHEVLDARGSEPGGTWANLRKKATRYNLDLLGGVRVFRMLGGYAKNSQMEQIGQMLNEGQRKQTEILVKGEALFDNVTGRENQKKMDAFAGPGAKLVDIGLTDTKGNAVPLTHAQLCSLYMHLRNADSRNHLLTGGLTLPDATLYHKGDIEGAYQKGQTVMLGTLTGKDGEALMEGRLVSPDGGEVKDNILQAVEKAMDDYDRAWCEDMKGFFGTYTANLINETSLKLLGYQRATVKNYYPIAVDKAQLAKEIEGLKHDSTIEGRGFLKNRQKSSKPILLEECSSVVQRSLRDTAAYAGLAAPIRDVQKILNSTVETAGGIGLLKNKIIREHWGADATDYIDELLTDLQTPGRKARKSSMTALGRLRGNYAGAILTLNPGVAIAQAASLPTAGAVLGADTMAAVVPFVKNLSGKQRAALEAEIREHGDVLLQYRKRGSQEGELSSMGRNQTLAEKWMEKAPKWLTGWINGMDEVTVAALWEGAKRYVEHHAEEFGLEAAARNEAYWKAVNQTYQRVIEETQPNYTTMQRAGIQRSDSELARMLTMFTTQRFQNYGILADAVGDYRAQKERFRQEASAENKAEVERAGKQLNRAVTSQVVQTTVFALMKMFSDLLLHRWDREQDENGDITGWSLFKRFADLFAGSAAGNLLYGSEAYSFVTNVAGGKDYDVVSAASLSALNDLGGDAMKLYKVLGTDTGEMDEEELAEYHEKLKKAALTLMTDGMELKGLPAGNALKLWNAAEGWGGNLLYALTKGEHGEALSFHSLPASATGQYDRLFDAIQSGDREQARGALDKLDEMGKSDQIDSQLKRRLKQYDPDIREAAEARNAGKSADALKAKQRVFERLRVAYDVKAADDRSETAEDKAKRNEFIDLINGAVDDVGDELLAGGKDRDLYDGLTEALESGRARDVQEELDRLMTAGKEAGDLKSKITKAVKPEYLAGSEGDRARMERMLRKLEDGDRNALYEEKTFAQWEKQDEKEKEAAKEQKDEWAGVR